MFGGTALTYHANQSYHPNYKIQLFCRNANPIYQHNRDNRSEGLQVEILQM